MATIRGLDIARRIWRWQAHSDGQREWLLCDAKVKVAACGRRWGKSESEAIDIALYALERRNTTQMIVAPTDDQTKIIMGEVSRRLHSVPGLSDCFVEKLSPYPQITFKDGNGLQRATTIMARTAGDDGKGLRGHKAHRVIVDEAAYVPDKVMQNVVTPLLADYDGQLILISTPAGRNHFWQSFVRGQDPLNSRTASFQFPTADNPYISQDYLKAEQQTKPERVFRIEYLAEFADEEGLVFRGVRDAVVPGRIGNMSPVPGRRYSMGVDLARVEDFTVLIVVDDLGRQVYFERFNQISWERQRAAIIRVARDYRATVWLDSTGVGDPIFEAVRREGVPTNGYQLTNASKELLIDNLAMQIEQGNIGLMDIETQTNELLSYAYEMTPSRNVKMNAPSGMHDDTVISLALAVYGSTRAVPGAPAAGGERQLVNAMRSVPGLAR